MDVIVQVTVCRECYGLSLVAGACVQCDQIDDLLSHAAQTQGEVERLRSTREAEMEIDWWTQALPYLQWKWSQALPCLQQKW